MLVAITRQISPAMAHCELTHLERQPIDIERAKSQHDAYERRLAEAGCAVVRVAAGVDMPDSVFIEDTAVVVVDEVAVVTRPGAASRRVETAAVADTLGRYREVKAIEAPGTLDGGDVLVVGKQVFVGRSSRTNQAGIDQLQAFLAPYDYAVHAVDVHGCLHLKSAVTALGDNLILLNPAWVSDSSFGGFDRIDVDPDEPLAANALRIEDKMIYPTSFPRTLERLIRRGLDVRAVDVSELQKAEGAVTCCSLIVRQA